MSLSILTFVLVHWCFGGSQTIAAPPECVLGLGCESPSKCAGVRSVLLYDSSVKTAP